jgi:hypothetical protein
MTHSHPTGDNQHKGDRYMGTLIQPSEGVKPTGYMGRPKQTIGDLHISMKGEKICLKESLQRDCITTLELAEIGIV